MSILTNKKAIEMGIESINQRDDLPKRTKEEAIERLTSMLDKDTFMQWDKESIIKALLDYKERNGVAPTVTNLCETGMPKNYTIQTYFHMRASVFLKQLFPELRDSKRTMHNEYGFETEEQWIGCFKEQFEKHIDEEMCSKKYNILRDKGTPTWETISRHCGGLSWQDLMQRANVRTKKYYRQPPVQLRVTDATSPLVEKLERLMEERRKLNEELFERLDRVKDI